MAAGPIPFAEEATSGKTLQLCPVCGKGFKDDRALGAHLKQCLEQTCRPSGVKSTRMRSGRPERRGECARLRERSRLRVL